MKELESKEEGRIEHLLGCLVQVIGRAAVPEDRVRTIVGAGRKQIRAFNLCDGTKTQSDIRRKVGLDQASLSRTAKRWIEHGVAFEIPDSGNKSKLLHIYPLGKAKGSRGGKSRRKR